MALSSYVTFSQVARARSAWLEHLVKPCVVVTKKKDTPNALSLRLVAAGLWGGGHPMCGSSVSYLSPVAFASEEWTGIWLSLSRGLRWVAW